MKNEIRSGGGGGGEGGNIRLYSLTCTADWIWQSRQGSPSQSHWASKSYEETFVRPESSGKFIETSRDDRSCTSTSARGNAPQAWAAGAVSQCAFTPRSEDSEMRCGEFVLFCLLQLMMTPSMGGLPRPRRHSSHSFFVKTDYQLVIPLPR